MFNDNLDALRSEAILVIPATRTVGWRRQHHPYAEGDETIARIKQNLSE